MNDRGRSRGREGRGSLLRRVQTVDAYCFVGPRVYQVHFFTVPSSDSLYGKLNWRITEPDGEFFERSVRTGVCPH